MSLKRHFFRDVIAHQAAYHPVAELVFASDYDALASETTAYVDKIVAEKRELEAEVQRLQRALSFWLPSVPRDGKEEILIRTGDDAMLLVGYEGPNEPTAEDLNWLNLRAWR